MIKREIVIFLVIGIATVIVDYITYRISSSLFSSNVALSKAIGFICGTFFSYFANRRWTFAHVENKSSNKLHFGILYLTTMCLNVLVNSTILKSLKGFEYSVQIAFLVATGLSASFNFLGMKFFVFNLKKR